METIRKLAVLVSSLDCDVADLLIQQFESDEASELRQTILGLQGVTELEEIEAIQSFLDQAPIPTLAADEPDEDLNFEHAIEPTVTSEKDGPSEKKSIRQYLEEASVEVVGRLLHDEHPQTIANVLSKMPAANASQVVSILPIDTQADVLQRIVELEKSPANEDECVQEELLEWIAFEIEASAERRELISRMSTVIISAPLVTRQKLLKNLAKTKSSFAQDLSERTGIDIAEIASPASH